MSKLLAWLKAWLTAHISVKVRFKPDPTEAAPKSQ
jgi:hypothetical protein